MSKISSEITQIAYHDSAVRITVKMIRLEDIDIKSFHPLNIDWIALYELINS